MLWLLLEWDLLEVPVDLHDLTVLTDLHDLTDFTDLHDLTVLTDLHDLGDLLVLTDLQDFLLETDFLVFLLEHDFLVFLLETDFLLEHDLADFLHLGAALRPWRECSLILRLELLLELLLLELLLTELLLLELLLLELLLLETLDLDWLRLTLDLELLTCLHDFLEEWEDFLETLRLLWLDEDWDRSLLESDELLLPELLWLLTLCFELLLLLLFDFDTDLTDLLQLFLDQDLTLPCFFPFHCLPHLATLLHDLDRLKLLRLWLRLTLLCLLLCLLLLLQDFFETGDLDLQLWRLTVDLLQDLLEEAELEPVALTPAGTA